MSPCDLRIVVEATVKGKYDAKNKSLKSQQNGNKLLITDGDTQATIEGSRIKITNNNEDFTLARFQANNFISKLEKSGLSFSGQTEEQHKHDLLIRETEY